MVNSALFLMKFVNVVYVFSRALLLLLNFTCVALLCFWLMIQLYTDTKIILTFIKAKSQLLITVLQYKSATQRRCNDCFSPVQKIYFAYRRLNNARFFQAFKYAVISFLIGKLLRNKFFSNNMFI